MMRARSLLLGLFALLVPACGGDQTVSPPLFQETFSGTFPGTAWTAVTAAGGGSAAISGSVGNPQPALNFKTSSATAGASTTTTGTFSSPGVTFTVQEQATMASPGLKGTGTISILDNTSAVKGFATWDPEVAQITFSLQGTAIPPIGAPTDGAFHVFRFRVDSGGTAFWSIDGLDKISSTNFPAGPLTLKLAATFGTGTAWPEFNFDNITISNP